MVNTVEHPLYSLGNSAIDSFVKVLSNIKRSLVNDLDDEWSELDPVFKQEGGHIYLIKGEDLSNDFISSGMSSQK